MKHPQRPLPFVLISSEHGTMIVNRNDCKLVSSKKGYGVGFQLLSTGCYEPTEVELALAFLHQRRLNFGDGVFALDCGANIGVHTIEWARFMTGWGQVVAFEPQEKVYYALAGNIVINNCLNASAKNYAVGASSKTIQIPEPDHLIPSSYGSFELFKKENNEDIGQAIDYKNTRKVPMVSIDSLELKRLDFVKIDVEGMEEEVLLGAKTAIDQFKPIMTIEHLKSDKAWIEGFLENYNYLTFTVGINIVAIHKDDPASSYLKSDEKIFS